MGLGSGGRAASAFGSCQPHRAPLPAPHRLAASPRCTSRPRSRWPMRSPPSCEGAAPPAHRWLTAAAGAAGWAGRPAALRGSAAAERPRRRRCRRRPASRRPAAGRGAAASAAAGADPPARCCRAALVGPSPPPGLACSTCSVATTSRAPSSPRAGSGCTGEPPRGPLPPPAAPCRPPGCAWAPVGPSPAASRGIRGARTLERAALHPRPLCARQAGPGGLHAVRPDCGRAGRRAGRDEGGWRAGRRLPGCAAGRVASWALPGHRGPQRCGAAGCGRRPRRRWALQARLPAHAPAHALPARPPLLSCPRRRTSLMPPAAPSRSPSLWPPTLATRTASWAGWCSSSAPSRQPSSPPRSPRCSASAGRRGEPGRRRARRAACTTRTLARLHAAACRQAWRGVVTQACGKGDPRGRQPQACWQGDARRQQAGAIGG